MLSWITPILTQRLTNIKSYIITKPSKTITTTTINNARRLYYTTPFKFTSISALPGVSLYLTSSTTGDESIIYDSIITKWTKWVINNNSTIPFGKYYISNIYDDSPIITESTIVNDNDDSPIITESTIVNDNDDSPIITESTIVNDNDDSPIITESTIVNDNDDDDNSTIASVNDNDDSPIITDDDIKHGYITKRQVNPFKRWLCILSSMLTLAFLWSSTILFPIFILYTFIKGNWKTLTALLSLWSSAILIDFPECPGVRDYLLKGCEYWFNDGVNVIFEHKPSKNKTIYCYHPHGAIAIGLCTSIRFLFYELDNNPDNYPVMVASPFLRWFCPSWKILFDICGVSFGGAGRKEFKRLLESGKSCVLVTGGFHEATITCPGTDRIYINNGRKGFVRYALHEGYSLTPIYGFGETDTYSNVQGMWSFRFWLNSGTFQIPAVWGLGHWLLPILPKRGSLRIVYGTPLKLPCIRNPSKDEVDKYHAIYVKSVRQLYNKYKPYDRNLQVW